MCYGTIIFAIHVEVCIKQIQFHATNVNSPYVGIDYTTGIGNLKDHGLAIFVHNLFDGELVEVLRLIVSYLLTINRERLCEVSIAIKEYQHSCRMLL